MAASRNPPDSPADRLSSSFRQPGIGAPISPRARRARFIPTLNDKKFALRERATRELEEIGLDAEKELEEALKKAPGLELKRRLEELLGRIRSGTAPGRLRQARIVEVLERIGPPAKHVLAELAAGDAGSWLTREAKALLDCRQP